MSAAPSGARQGRRPARLRQPSVLDDIGRSLAGSSVSSFQALGRSLQFERWAPASVLALSRYSTKSFVADLIAGVTVGLVALPLAMAFAVSSGMSR